MTLIGGGVIALVVAAFYSRVTSLTAPGGWEIGLSPPVQASLAAGLAARTIHPAAAGTVYSLAADQLRGKITVEPGDVNHAIDQALEQITDAQPAATP
jgi:hypothetical protein